MMGLYRTITGASFHAAIVALNGRGHHPVSID
jgi:hypothetical protein